MTHFYANIWTLSFFNKLNQYFYFYSSICICTAVKTERTRLDAADVSSRSEWSNVFTTLRFSWCRHRRLHRPRRRSGLRAVCRSDCCRRSWCETSSWFWALRTNTEPKHFQSTWSSGLGSKNRHRITVNLKHLCRPLLAGCSTRHKSRLPLWTG